MNQISLLLVEDNEGDILLTLDALREHDIASEIAVIKDGSEAIRYIENSGQYCDAPEPDLILLDINLPKLNGFEVLEKIRLNDKKKHITVVMLTTSAAEVDIARSNAASANGYIVKAADAEDFERVAIAIEGFRQSISDKRK